jgi:hypothetical protein
MCVRKSTHHLLRFNCIVFQEDLNDLDFDVKCPRMSPSASFTTSTTSSSSNKPDPEMPSQVDINSNQVVSSKKYIKFEVSGPPNQSSPPSSICESESGLFKCDSCGSKFAHDYQLWFHWRDHIPKNGRFLCTLCPFVSTSPTTLKSHICGGHQVISGVACNVCRGAFVAKNRADLSRHVFRSHMFDKRFHATLPTTIC